MPEVSVIIPLYNTNRFTLSVSVIFENQNDYFNKATAEKNIRGLDGKGW